MLRTRVLKQGQGHKSNFTVEHQSDFLRQKSKESNVGISSDY